MVGIADMVHDLLDSLSLSNVTWSAWEREFIENVTQLPLNKLSTAQEQKIEELWEKL